MRLPVTAALLALASTTAADVVRLPVARSSLASVRRRSPHLSKRATLTESLINNITEGGYYATVSVGTPGQSMSMVLDTGSSDAWVVADDANLCTSQKLQEEYDETCGATCKIPSPLVTGKPLPPPGSPTMRNSGFADLPPVDPSKSSTYKDLGSVFEIEYVDGSTASGAYFTDDFSIGGKTVKNLQMALANETVVGTGILGIGFELNEAAEQLYPNLIVDLVNQSIVSVMAYSLYLNDYYSSTGSILFGGVDTDKFIGNLVTVPILPDAQSHNYSSFTVGLTGLSFASSNGTTYNQSLTSESGSIDSVLDSGTTLTYLPDTIADALFEAVGAYQYTSDGSSIALVDCSLNVDFTFRINNTAVISVPADELVIDAFTQEQVPSEVPFKSTCLFGLQNIGDTSDDSGGGGGGSGSSSSQDSTNYAILGDTFLRSAYVVYDLDNLQIGLAQANLNSTSSNVQDLKAGLSSLPAFSGVASQTAAASSGTSTSGGGGGSATGTASSSGTLTPGGGGGSTATCLGGCVLLATSVAVLSGPTLGTSVGAGRSLDGATAGISVTAASSRAGGSGRATSAIPSSGVEGSSSVFSYQVRFPLLTVSQLLLRTTRPPWDGARRVTRVFSRWWELQSHVPCRAACCFGCNRGKRIYQHT